MWTFSFCSNARSFDRPTVAKSGEKIKVPIFIRRKGADIFRPALAAGAMLYVVVEELIPEMSQGQHSNVGTVFFAVGFSVMMVLDVALG